MAMGDKKAGKIATLAQTKISEPVVCAAIVVPKGRHGALAAGGLIGQAIHSSSTGNHGFASTNIFAVTDHALYAFKAGQNLGITIKELIGWWPWGSFGASTGKGNITRFLFLYWQDGQVSELEVHATGINKFQGMVVDEIVRRSAAAAAPPPAWPPA